MSTEYTVYPSPHQVPVLDAPPLDLSDADTEAIRDLVATSAVAVRAAHVYDRKGYFTTDDFTDAPNPAYRGSRDDIVVQVTLVVSSEPTQHNKYETLTGIYQRVQTAKHEAEVRARRDEVAQAEADLAAAQARLDAVRRP